MGGTTTLPLEFSVHGGYFVSRRIVISFNDELISMLDKYMSLYGFQCYSHAVRSILYRFLTSSLRGFL